MLKNLATGALTFPLRRRKLVPSLSRTRFSCCFSSRSLRVDRYDKISLDNSLGEKEQGSSLPGREREQANGFASPLPLARRESEESGPPREPRAATCRPPRVHCSRALPRLQTPRRSTHHRVLYADTDCRYADTDCRCADTDCRCAPA